MWSFIIPDHFRAKHSGTKDKARTCNIIVAFISEHHVFTLDMIPGTCGEVQCSWNDLIPTTTKVNLTI